tara:strand:+ start:1764 stop:2114 length:351 start_codon:yes stop_codon:yes gene_type:complete
MQSDFDTTPRFFAFPLSELGRIGELVAAYGAGLPDTPKDPASPTTVCLAGGLDREGSDDLRSMDYPTTASTVPLTDGRHASLGCWTNAILTAVAGGEVIAEELTAGQFTSLQYNPE